ncbi:hypothetical protein [Natrinema thermotolerans]
MDAKDPTRFGRRGFLASIASSGLLAGLVGVGSAASDDDAGPVTVSGRRIHKYRPDGDFFEHEQRFVSPELRDYYGKATLVYDEGTIHRRAVPDEYTDPDRAFTLNYRDTAVIGRFREFDRLETKQRDAGSADAAVGTASIPDYTGPLYVYNSDVDNPQEEDLGEATGPINVGWNRDLDRDAASINSQMESWGWTSLYAGSPGDRYVIMDEDASLPYVTKQDEHIVKGLSTPTTQYPRPRVRPPPVRGGEHRGRRPGAQGSRPPRRPALELRRGPRGRLERLGRQRVLDRFPLRRERRGIRH